MTMNSASLVAAGGNKKEFEKPQLSRQGRMPLVTAGSFDLIIPTF